MNIRNIIISICGILAPIQTSAQYQTAIDSLEQQIALASSESGNKLYLAECYEQLGSIQRRQNDAAAAETSYSKALNIYKSENDTAHIISVSNKLANIFVQFERYRVADKILDNALKLGYQINDSDGIIRATLSKGSLFNKIYNIVGTDSILYVAKKCFKDVIQRIENGQITDNLNEDGMMTNATYGLINIFHNQALTSKGSERQIAIDSCYYYIELTRQYAAKRKRKGNITDNINICEAKYLTLIGQKKQALKILRETESKLDPTSNRSRRIAENLYNAFVYYGKSNNDYKMVYDYNQKLEKINDKLAKSEFIVQTVQQRMQNNFSEQIEAIEQAEHDRQLVYEEKVKHQRMMIIFFSICFVIMSFLAFIAYKNSQKRKRLNIKLNEQNTILEYQRNKLTEANNQITASIEYAKRIQTAAIPSIDMMQSIFGDCLVLFRPLNIVSGDYYWAAQTQNYKILVGADCTGHGIPGAFMSMLGITLLNDIVASDKFINDKMNAADMLNELRKSLMKALRQTGASSDNHDGMDIALCLLDNRRKDIIQYAGAFRPLYLIRNKEIKQYAPDRMPVGVHIGDAHSFTNNIINVEPGDLLYIFTDGLTDQFGYSEKGRQCKYTAKRVKNLLLDNYTKSFAHQRSCYELAIDKWKGGEENGNNFDQTPCEQTDDILLLGIRIE